MRKHMFGTFGSFLDVQASFCEAGSQKQAKPEGFAAGSKLWQVLDVEDLHRLPGAVQKDISSREGLRFGASDRQVRQDDFA